MRNATYRALIAGIASLSLAAPVLATTEPAAAAYRYGGGWHGGWHGGGWHRGWHGGAGWWGPDVVGGLVAGARVGGAVLRV